MLQTAASMFPNMLEVKLKEGFLRIYFKTTIYIVKILFDSSSPRNHKSNKKRSMGFFHGKGS